MWLSVSVLVLLSCMVADVCNVVAVLLNVADFVARVVVVGADCASECASVPILPGCPILEVEWFAHGFF
jgi:hypothetical protein